MAEQKAKEQEVGMDKTQEEKFLSWYIEHLDQSSAFDIAKRAYEYALEANGIGEEPRIPEGYYKIGDEIEVYDNELQEWSRGAVIGRSVDGLMRYSPEAVRRIPSWEPKDGEAVLYESTGYKAIAGVYHNGDDGECVFHESYCGRADPKWMKPFDASKLGKPWSEI